MVHMSHQYTLWLDLQIVISIHLQLSNHHGLRSHDVILGSKYDDDQSHAETTDGSIQAQKDFVASRKVSISNVQYHRASLDRASGLGTAFLLDGEEFHEPYSYFMALNSIS